MTLSTIANPDAEHPAWSYTQALDAWQAGAHDEALASCTQLLAADPHNADVLQLAGVLHIGRDQGMARTLLGRALAVREDADVLVNLALTYDAAETAQREALLERALELNPQSTHALNNLANLYGERGELGRSLACFERLLSIQPDNALAHYNYGSLLLTNGAAGRAEVSLRRAVELDPAYANAWNNLASALIGLNRFSEALVLLTHACSVLPASADILMTVGILYSLLGRHAEAHATLARAVEMEPHNASPWNYLGALFYDLGQLDKARPAFVRAIELRPGYADAHGNLASVLKAAGDIEAAISGYRSALACDPGNRAMHANLAYALTFATDDAATIRAEAEAYSARHEAPWLAQAVTHANSPERARRLRIGYVSPDFRQHCQALFMTPLLAHHDHRAFEIVCYSTTSRPDDVTRRLASYADLWRDVREFDDERLARQIRDDGIDILVDLTMHMDGARRLVFARRPAPVQVAWLAYPGTTGSAAIGWRLTDPWLDPPGVPGVDAQYTERSLRLPDSFWCYDAQASGVEVSALPALAVGHVTFGCLNNPCKLTDATLALWSGVFAALPDARLVLLAPEGEARAKLAARLASHGVQAARVRFVGMQAREDYLRTWSQIDIALDTVPYNGHTTSLDAFWMGVPVPTRVGRAVAGRAGLSLLANLGLRDLAAHSDAEYVAIVTALARDLPRLAALRAGLRERMTASPLMDGARFARAVEGAYRQMWGAWCATAATGEPEDARAWFDRGNLLRDQGDVAQSEAAFRRAAELAPDDPEVLSNLASLIAQNGRYAEAQPLLEHALAVRPDFAGAWRNLANVFMATDRKGEAIEAYRRAIDLAPGFARPRVLLAALLMSAGETAAAIGELRHAVADDPADVCAHSDLAYATMFVTDDGHAIRAEAEAFSRRHEAPLMAVPAWHANVRDPARRLRIGYVSPDFLNHCQSLFTLPLLAHHDHAAHEIFCYASVARPDVVTRRIASHADVWRDVHALDDAQLAQQIRHDGIDILVDLTMHMASARRRLFAMRPAPVQVAWLAYPGTTGSPAMGWRLTDPRLDPEGAPEVDAQYTERSLRLPDTFWCYAPFYDADRTAQPGSLPALAAGHITFGCLNNPCKLTDATLALWSGVFEALPDARLMLLAASGLVRDRLKTRFAMHGIDPTRVTFVGYQNRLDYLRTYAQIDIALDTFPYNGHTTSLDAFWMGVPVPTRAGRSAASRGALSLLANLGLTDLAAHSDARYVAIVSDLARDLPRLAALREGLRERMLASPLMDAPRFARAMEAAFRQMWRAWCEEVSPLAA